jgi:uncharacterized protein (UPF0276 family)
MWWRWLRRGVRQLIRDRVGIAWRPELAAGILSHVDEIDVVEVLLEEYIGASRKALQALRFLSAHVPVVYHGVTLGPASTHPVDPRRLERVARTLEALEVESWSEHLAFVRAAGIEIGHLAAPPRTIATIDGTVSNLHRLRGMTGLMPALENIATLVEPPGSTLSEPEWVSGIASEAHADLLIDLHNLLCNAHTTALDPERYLLGFPLERVTHVHLSGGHWIPEPLRHAKGPGAMRLLDDHLHPVPPKVFSLLSRLASGTQRPLTVIIERDGNYPAFASLLCELRAARAALARGRSSRKEAALNECA